MLINIRYENNEKYYIFNLIVKNICALFAGCSESVFPEARIGNVFFADSPTINQQYRGICIGSDCNMSLKRVWIVNLSQERLVCALMPNKFAINIAVDLDWTHVRFNPRIW